MILLYFSWKGTVLMILCILYHILPADNIFSATSSDSQANLKKYCKNLIVYLILQLRMMKCFPYEILLHTYIPNTSDIQENQK